MTRDYRINYQLPASPLGPAVGEKQPKEECPFLSFETENRDWVIAPRSTETKAEQREPKWIPWDCLGSTLAPKGVLEAKLRNGSICPGDRITDWGDCGGLTAAQIVAYRLQEKEEDPLLRAFKEDGIVREFRVGDRVKSTRNWSKDYEPSPIIEIRGNRARVGWRHVLGDVFPYWDQLDTLEHV